MDGEELGPAQDVSEDVPDIEDIGGRGRWRLRHDARSRGRKNLDGEYDVAENARGVGNEQADRRDLKNGGYGGARTVVSVDGVQDGDDGPRQRREHRDEQDPPARDEGLERLRGLHALEDPKRVRENRHFGIRWRVCEGLAKFCHQATVLSILSMRMSMTDCGNS